MNVLGLDTSTSASAACVLRADGVAFEVVPDLAELTAPPGHARDLMPRIAEVIERAGLDYPEINRIAVGVGPGSFTGLRVGIATARGLAVAHGLPIHPVSSLRALAEGIDAPVRVPVIDARRGELFAEIVTEAGGADPFVAAPGEVAERAAAAGSSVLVAGDGSLRFRGLFEAAGVRVADAGSSAHVVRALNVCRLAAGARPVAPEAVLPNYLRAPDARPQP